MGFALGSGGSLWVCWIGLEIFGSVFTFFLRIQKLIYPPPPPSPPRGDSGSHIECQYALVAFGVPSHLLPISTDGSVRLVYHLDWLQSRRAQERLLVNSVSPSSNDLSIAEDGDPTLVVAARAATTSVTNNAANDLTSDGIKVATAKKDIVSEDDAANTASSRLTISMQEGLAVVPNRDDVLMGCGKLSNRHEGNKKYNLLLDEYRDQYNNSSKFERRLLPKLSSVPSKILGTFFKVRRGWYEQKVDGSEW